MLDFHFQISHVEFWGQTTNNRILDCKNFDILTFDIDWNCNISSSHISSLCSLLAMIGLNQAGLQPRSEIGFCSLLKMIGLHEAGHQPQEVKSENLLLRSQFEDIPSRLSWNSLQSWSALWSFTVNSHASEPSHSKASSTALWHAVSRGLWGRRKSEACRSNHQWRGSRRWRSMSSSWLWMSGRSNSGRDPLFVLEIRW